MALSGLGRRRLSGTCQPIHIDARVGAVKQARLLRLLRLISRVFSTALAFFLNMSTKTIAIEGAYLRTFLLFLFVSIVSNLFLRFSKQCRITIKRRERTFNFVISSSNSLYFAACALDSSTTSKNRQRGKENTPYLSSQSQLQIQFLSSVSHFGAESTCPLVSFVNSRTPKFPCSSRQFLSFDLGCCSPSASIRLSISKSLGEDRHSVSAISFQLFPPIHEKNFVSERTSYSRGFFFFVNGNHRFVSFNFGFFLNRVLRQLF